MILKTDKFKSVSVLWEAQNGRLEAYPQIFHYTNKIKIERMLKSVKIKGRNMWQIKLLTPFPYINLKQSCNNSCVIVRVLEALFCAVYWQYEEQHCHDAK